MDCDHPLPQSGLTVAQKYGINKKMGPVGLLVYGGKYKQVEPSLLKKEDDSLGKSVRKLLSARFSITNSTSAVQVRRICAKSRCVVWSHSATFFGAREAINFPKWVHVRLPSSVLVGTRPVKRSALVWQNREKSRLAIFVDPDSKFAPDTKQALSAFEEDPAFAEVKAEKLPWDWAAEATSGSARQARKESNRGSDMGGERSDEQARAHDTVDREEERTEEAPLHWEGDDIEDSGIDLDEL